MILFKLKCEIEHEFETWFRDGAAFDRQRTRGQIACPECGSNVIDKAPMAPRPLRASIQKVTPNPPSADDVRRVLQVLRRQIETNYEHVGPRFAMEARAIYEGISKKRGIYGETTPEESRALADDGIEFLTIPWVTPNDA